jgi:hypothetical protein
MLQLQIYNKEMFQNREYPIQFILGMFVFHKSNSNSVFNSSFKKFIFRLMCQIEMAYSQNLAIRS